MIRLLIEKRIVASPIINIKDVKTITSAHATLDPIQIPPIRLNMQIDAAEKVIQIDRKDTNKPIGAAAYYKRLAF